MEFRDWIKNLFKGKEKSNTLQTAGTMTGYTPQFTAFGSSVNLSDLVIESIRLKADFCSKLDPRYIRTTNGTQTIIGEGDIAKCLRNPNPYMTTADFLYKACFLREVNENVFIYPDYFKTRGGEKKYTGLYILQPTNWQYYEYADGSLAIGFRFNGKSDEVVFDYADLIHWRKHYEGDDYDGGGQHSANGNRDLLNTLQAYRTICESIAEAAKCGCYFDGILKVNAYGQTDEKVKAIRDSFISGLRTGTYKGVGVLDNGAEWQDIKRNLTMVDEKTMQHFTSKILMHTGVSMAMLSGDFTTAQKEAFYERCIESAVISLGQAFTKCFFSQGYETGREVIFYPNKIDLMSTTEKVSLLGATNASGVWSVNEIREMFGKPPVDGGDVRPRGYNSLDGATAEPTATVPDKGGDLTADEEQDLVKDVQDVVKEPLLVGQLQALSQIVADYQAGKYTFNQAVNMLMIGVGLSKDEDECILDKQDDTGATGGGAE